MTGSRYSNLKTAALASGPLTYFFLVSEIIKKPVVFPGSIGWVHWNKIDLFLQGIFHE